MESVSGSGDHPFSEDERDLVRTLHNLLGDRFSLIAGRLPDRNAAEIEEYWNARHYQLTHGYINPDKALSTHNSSSCATSVSRDHRPAFPSGNKQRQPSRGAPREESVDSSSGFSEDEEALIRRLHALLGNRWPIMSRVVPGRSAEQIEECWNRMEMQRRRAEEYPNSLARPS